MNKIEIPVRFVGERSLEEQRGIMQGLQRVYEVSPDVGLELHESDFMDTILLKGNVLYDEAHSLLGEFAILGCYDTGVLGCLYPDESVQGMDLINRYFDKSTYTDWVEFDLGLPVKLELGQDDETDTRLATIKNVAGRVFEPFSTLSQFDLL